ncbi:BTAD domain-containing putative transcriptional regulator [Micromonospora cathayae]|uniref:BTAD domain-containing putative transcriptional regulator n=1 Tax=Micromonospora cathayae TaxID=3028804 RepID=A0ABY7ZVN4_9ACTN|nr:BTAD domain-containing putative transcriptional regulator [Micromonospora sp. HUAS 3]WDZ86538.1 BTAD domain-containing putative transcriptional regulator [Micromonospora sp. HUAS 3]
MEFRVLGPLQVVEEAEPISLGGTNQRAALGYLLLYTNKVVATSQLMAALWGEDAPPTARKMLQNAISSLRRTLTPGRHGSGTLVTHAPGYLIQVDPVDVDLCRFRELAAAGHTDLNAGRWDDADRHFGDALALWRGPALADLIEEGYDWPELTALQNAKFAALESRMEAVLAAGRSMEVIAELEPMVGTEPLRERLCRQLMLALYRVGRQADALAVYRRTRAVLVGRLGLDPGPELRDLERAILDHDPALLPGGGAAVVAGRTVGGSTAGAVETGASTGLDGPDGNGPALAESALVPVVRRPHHYDAELKQLTALFVRFESGHNPASPEVIELRLDLLEETVCHLVGRYGGRHHGRLGPVLLTVFGAERTREDDAQRAIRAAVALSRQYREVPCLRIAVVTGEALVGAVRSDQVAEPGDRNPVSGPLLDKGLRILFDPMPKSVRICERTRQICADHFDFGLPGERWLSVRQGLHLATRPTVPFVDRERELQQLGRLLEDVRRQQRPNLVTVLGEAGIGKSRLMHEFRTMIAGLPGVRCLVGCNRLFGPEVPYAPLVGVVRSYAGITDADREAQLDDKLRQAVTGLVGPGPVAGQVIRSLRAIVGGEWDDPVASDPAELTAAFTAWRRLVEELAERETLVIILEDLHRVDDLLLRFVGNLAETVGNLPLLVVVTARPELVDRPAFWEGARRRATTMSLGPMSQAGIQTLLRSLLGPVPEEQATELGRSLSGQVGGNPLFAMEYVRTVQSRPGGSTPVGAEGPDRLPVPDLVHNIISARLDTLPATEKSVLYDAAVFDASFFHEVLAAIGGRDANEVQQCLESLERQELVRRCRLGPELGKIEYTFAHDLVARVAYSRLPHSVRSEKHRRAANWLQSVADRPVQLLIHHWQEAVRHAELAGLKTDELCDLAVDHLAEAARRTSARGMLLAARLLYQAALRFCSPEHPRHAQLVQRYELDSAATSAG